MRTGSLIFLLALRLLAQAPSFSEVAKLVEQRSPKVKDVLPLTKGSAWMSEGPAFVWAVEAKQAALLIVDEEAPRPMAAVKGTSLWVASGKLTVGRTHNFP